jgi:flagellar motor component MotA
MRITLDIPDPLHRKLKQKAASDGCTMKALIIRGVERELSGRRPPIIASKRPGSLQLDNAKIFEIIPFP